jgi:hypothetical protein
LVKAGKIDLDEAEHQAGLNLIPYIQRGTHVDTGEMRAGWEVRKDAFINDVPYAGYAEYGTSFMRGADAIRKAVDSHEDLLLKPFEKETDDARKKAGFGR